MDYRHELGEIMMAVPPESRQAPPTFSPFILDRLATVDRFKGILAELIFFVNILRARNPRSKLREPGGGSRWRFKGNRGILP